MIACGHPNWNARGSRPPAAPRIKSIRAKDHARHDRHVGKSRENRGATLGRGAAKNGSCTGTNSTFGKNAHQASAAQSRHPHPQSAPIGPGTIHWKSVEPTEPGGEQRVVIKFFGRHPIDRPAEEEGEENRIEMRDVIRNHDRAVRGFDGARHVPDAHPREGEREDARCDSGKSVTRVAHPERKSSLTINETQSVRTRVVHRALLAKRSPDAGWQGNGGVCLTNQGEPVDVR